MKKRGFENPIGVSITVEKNNILPDVWINITWQQIYHWATKHKTEWALILVDYFNAAENRMVKENYLKEGTITEFTGIPFGKEEQFTYLEGKRVLRLLMKKVRNNMEIGSLDLNIGHSGRSAITQSEWLWDFIPFNSHGESTNFTENMHCTFGIGANECKAYITVPNNMKGIKKRVKSLNFKDFQEAAEKIVSDFENADEFKEGCSPTIEVWQRRYPSQRSIPIIDGYMRFDLRTAISRGGGVKIQQEWLKTSLEILQNKNSNLQLGVGVNFEYDKCIAIKSSNADELFVKAWQASMPIRELFL
ncbi:MAG: hypothetical protein PQ614_09145 [Rickettsiales bacterium]|nr:hypothetical protein [Rickettsiales bacterium]